MKRIYLFLLLSFAVFAQTNLVRVPASTVGGSGAKCQLRGVSGTRTAAIDSINGVYNNPYFEFTVTTSGRYDLYYDSNGTTGGLSYSKQTDWSGTYGRWISGLTDVERSLSFQEIADTDNDGKVETAGLEDSVITSIKIKTGEVKGINVADSTLTLSKLTTAAYNFIGSGGTVTNNPDDISLGNKAGSTIGIKESYFVANDTTILKTLNRDSVGSFVSLKQLSSSNANGGGMFVLIDSTFSEAHGGGAFGSSATGKQWVMNLLQRKKSVSVKDFGAKGDNSNDDTDEIQNALNFIGSINGGGTVTIPEGSYVISQTLIRPINVSIIGEESGNLEAPKPWWPRLRWNGAADDTMMITDGTYLYNFPIRNLTFDGDSIAGYGIVFKDTSATPLVSNSGKVDFGTTIENVYFRICRKDAVVFENKIVNFHARHVRIDGSQWCWNMKGGANTFSLEAMEADFTANADPKGYLRMEKSANDVIYRGAVRDLQIEATTAPDSAIIWFDIGDSSNVSNKLVGGIELSNIRQVSTSDDNIYLLGFSVPWRYAHVTFNNIRNDKYLIKNPHPNWMGSGINEVREIPFAVYAPYRIAKADGEAGLQSSTILDNDTYIRHLVIAPFDSANYDSYGSGKDIEYDSLPPVIINPKRLVVNPKQGSIEYDGAWYLTDSSETRHRIDTGQDVIGILSTNSDQAITISTANTFTLITGLTSRVSLNTGASGSRISIQTGAGGTPFPGYYQVTANISFTSAGQDTFLFKINSGNTSNVPQAGDQDSTFMSMASTPYANGVGNVTVSGIWDLRNLGQLFLGLYVANLADDDNITIKQASFAVRRVYK